MPGLRTLLYILIQCTWGLLQTAAGAAVFLAYRKRPRSFYHGAVVTQWPRSSSLSLGLFVFLSHRPPRDRSGRIPDGEIGRRLLVHEYGHTVQSLILGPLYLPAIGLPSVLWAQLPACRRIWRGKVSYFAFFPERSADLLGERVTREPSMRQAVI